MDKTKFNIIIVYVNYSKNIQIIGRLENVKLIKLPVKLFNKNCFGSKLLK